jgi:hypothetical protein
LTSTNALSPARKALFGVASPASPYDAAFATKKLLNVVFTGEPVQADVVYCWRVYRQAVPVEVGSLARTVYVLSALGKSLAGRHVGEFRVVPPGAVTTNR